MTVKENWEKEFDKEKNKDGSFHEALHGRGNAITALNISKHFFIEGDKNGRRRTLEEMKERIIRHKENISIAYIDTELKQLND